MNYYEKTHASEEMKSDEKAALKKPNETNGCGHNVKRPYSRMTITPIKVEGGNPILAGSVVNNSKIESVGQEIGPSFNFSSDIDSNTGKTFSHEWESSL